MKKRFFGLAVFLLLILTSVAYPIDDPFIVRVIYFRATDAPELDYQKYANLITDMQRFFRNEMQRYQFGNKTFKVETDDNNNIKIHVINGNHDGNHYAGEIFTAYYQKISPELPFAINNTRNRNAQQSIYIVILSGVELVDDGRGSPWGSGWLFTGVFGGTAIINENFEQLYPNHYKSIIGHEFGHALGLQHNIVPNALMGPLPFGSFGQLTEFETALLNKHHLFNDVHILNNPPQIASEITIKPVGKDFVRLEVEAIGTADLYHCQIHKGMNYIGSDSLDGKKDTIQIKISRDTVKNGDTLYFAVYDVNGNRNTKRFGNILLPEPVQDNSKLKYLTIRHKHPDSLVPINNALEWVGWKDAGVFEKTPNGISQQLPPW